MSDSASLTPVSFVDKTERDTGDISVSGSLIIENSVVVSSTVTFIDKEAENTTEVVDISDDTTAVITVGDSCNQREIKVTGNAGESLTRKTRKRGTELLLI